jgi:hypothetical protein
MLLIVLQPVQLGSCHQPPGKTRESGKKEIGRDSLNLPANCYMRLGETAREEIPMGITNHAGSAVLHKRIRAFSDMAISFSLMGIDPVSAVALALGVTVVLAMV